MDNGQSFYDSHPKLWRANLKNAIGDMLDTKEMSQAISFEHTKNTPERFLKALDEYFSGIGVDTKSLITTFPIEELNGSPPQMIHVGGHQFYSMCAHHLAPFFGKMHFAYIPNKRIVGLSKIPRLMNAFSRRPQVQEKLTNDIVNEFQELVEPAGCALLIRASHFCMEARGVMAHGTETTTTALRGIFTDEKVKNEFLLAANRLEWR